MKARYLIVKETPEAVVICDVGPWDQFSSVTNAAESVVDGLASRLNGRRLFYYDSEGEYGELKVKDGAFAGFAFADPSPKK